jgi:hypothetical protein
METLRILKEGLGKAPILEKKIKGFKEREDYALSFGENGERVYEICSLELKKNLWEVDEGRKISASFRPEI